MLFDNSVLPAQQYSRSSYTFRNLLNRKDQTVNDLYPVNATISNFLTRRANYCSSFATWALRVDFLSCASLFLSWRCSATGGYCGQKQNCGQQQHASHLNVKIDAAMWR
jgi:hypothetical protein